MDLEPLLNIRIFDPDETSETLTPINKHLVKLVVNRVEWEYRKKLLIGYLALTEGCGLHLRNEPDWFDDPIEDLNNYYFAARDDIL